MEKGGKFVKQVNSCLNIHALSTKTASFQEFFVCQLTPFLAAVRGFIKKKNKAKHRCRHDFAVFRWLTWLKGFDVHCRLFLVYLLRSGKVFN